MAAEIVTTITTAFTSTATAIGKGVVGLFTDLMSTTDGKLSNLGIFILVMAGVGFAFGLSKMLVGLIRNRG